MFGDAFLCRLKRSYNAGELLREQDPQLTQLIDSAFEDVLLYPEQHPDIVLPAPTNTQETRTGDLRARSGWFAPNIDQDALVFSFLSRSKSARIIRNIVRWLEQMYVPRVDHEAGVYVVALEYLRAGQAESAVEWLEKQGCSIQASMLAGAIMSHVVVGYSSKKCVGVAGNTSFVDWMKKAQAYAKDPRTSANERAIFGIMGGNSSYYLSLHKTKNPESVLWAESRASLMGFILAACEGEDDVQLNNKADAQLAELLRHLPEEERLIVTCNFLGLANHLSTRCILLRDGAASAADFLSLNNLCLLALHILASMFLLTNGIASHNFHGAYIRSSNGNKCISELQSIVGWYGSFAIKLCNNERAINPNGPLSGDVIRAASLLLLICAHLEPIKSIDLLSDFLALLDDSHDKGIGLCIMALEASNSYVATNSLILTSMVQSLRLLSIRKINKLVNETAISPTKLFGCSHIAISDRMPLSHLLTYSVHAFLIRRLFMSEEYDTALRVAEEISTYAQAKNLFQNSLEADVSAQSSEDDATILYRLHSECTCLLSVLKGIYCSEWAELSKDTPLSLIKFPSDKDSCAKACENTEQHLLDALEFVLNGQLRNYDPNGRYSKKMAQLEKEFADNFVNNGVEIDRFLSLRRVETAVANQCCLKYCELMFRMGSLFANSKLIEKARSYYEKLGEFSVWIISEEKTTGAELASFLTEPVIKDILGYISKGVLCLESLSLIQRS